MQKNVTVVIPVYGDLPSLKVCIDSLLKFLNPKHKVLLVNDCGPQADEIEKAILEIIKDQKNFKYVRNPKNIGFVKTCNWAVLELDKTDNDILLLNSDTEATEGFLDELQSVLYAEDKIAVATPRTNNATIATIPVIAMNYKGIDPKKAYKLFLKIKDKLPRYNEVPTAHGFCMLIRREIIKKYGLFDEIFGKGYGEENDFSQRLIKHGYKSVLSNRSFVYHLEGKSFGINEKQKIIAKNRKIIDQRYPNYTKDVRDYFKKIYTEEAKSYPVLLKYFLKLNLHVKSLK